jgi:hypothetical protein
VLAMPDVGLDIMRCVESVCMVPLGADVLRLLVLGAAVGVIIDRRCEVDGVEVTRGVISATRELFSQDEGVYRTPSLRGIPLASWYGNASHRRRMLRILQRPTLLLIPTSRKTSNIWSDRSCVWVGDLGMHIPI